MYSKHPNKNYKVRNKYDTAEFPPGGIDKPLAGPMPNRGQSLNTGYGTTRPQLRQGYNNASQPAQRYYHDMYGTPSPQRSGSLGVKEGFLRRSTIPNER